MGQIVSRAAKPKRCNANQLSQMPTPAAGEYILVSSDNSMNAAGQGNFDCYIVGVGNVAASELPLKFFNQDLIDDEEVLAQVLINHNKRLDELESSSESIGEDEELVISTALNDLNERIESSSTSVEGYVSPDNSDVINILGASFSDGSTPAQGKDWTSILSALTDYNYINYSASGSNMYGWLNNRVRTQDIKGKYTMVTTWRGNSITPEDFPKLGDYLLDSIESLGSTPIICSSYLDGPADTAYLKSVAEKRNYYYCPCGEYFALTKAGRSRVGDNGYHLGTRDIGVWSNGYLIQIPYIDRPTQSFKVFRLRSNSYNKTLDELVFRTNEERFANFRELYFGQVHGGNEYSNIATGITFTNAALFSIILPVDTKHLSSLAFSMNTNDDVQVYALNALASPYPQLTYYSRFSIAENVSTLPTSGAVYSDGTRSFTVNSIVAGENGMNFTMYCTPAINSTEGSGTLTKVSGGGDTTLNYTMREYSTLSLSDALANDNGGHWVELQKSGNSYNIGINGYVRIDKVHILVVGSGDFTLAGMKVVYTGSKYKEKTRGHRVDFDSSEYSGSEEIIQESTFGSIGNTLSEWKDEENNSVITEASYDNKYCFDASIVKLSDIKTMSQSVELTKGKYYLEVFAKYLTTVVDEESYDFNDLVITVTSQYSTGSDSSYKIINKVGLYPTIARVPIIVGENKTVNIKLSSNELGIEVHKVSLKKF